MGYLYSAPHSKWWRGGRRPTHQLDIPEAQLLDTEADWRRINCPHSDHVLLTRAAVFPNSKESAHAWKDCISRPVIDLVQSGNRG